MKISKRSSCMLITTLLILSQHSIHAQESSGVAPSATSAAPPTTSAQGQPTTLAPSPTQPPAKETPASQNPEPSSSQQQQKTASPGQEPTQGAGTPTDVGQASGAGTGNGGQNSDLPGDGETTGGDSGNSGETGSGHGAGQNGNQTAIIAGAVAGGVVLLGFLAGLIFCFTRRRNKQKQINYRQSSDFRLMGDKETGSGGAESRQLLENSRRFVSPSTTSGYVTLPDQYEYSNYPAPTHQMGALPYDQNAGAGYPYYTEYDQQQLVVAPMGQVTSAWPAAVPVSQMEKPDTVDHKPNQK